MSEKRSIMFKIEEKDNGRGVVSVSPLPIFSDFLQKMKDDSYQPDGFESLIFLLTEAIAKHKE